jgi:hypothetical protein
VLLPALPALAVESECTTPYPSGEWIVQDCFLCDGDHSSTDCAEFDLRNETTMGLPMFLTADLGNTTGCSGAPEVAVRGLTVQLGMPHVYATLSAAGTSAVRVDPIRHLHLDADVDVATSADCSDLEVILRLFYPREP